MWPKISAGSAKRPMPMRPEARRPAPGPDDDGPTVPQYGHVVLGGWVVPHVGVHRRSEKQGGLGGERGGGESVVREALSQAGKGMCRGWGDGQYLGAAGQRHVLNGQLGVGIEHVGDHGAVGEAAERKGCDEFGGVVSQDDIDVGPLLGQLAGEVEGLVAGDTAGDAEDYVLAVKDIRHGSVIPFFSVVGVAVEFVNHSQAQQGEVGIDGIKDGGLAGHEIGQASGGDNLGIGTQLALEAGHHALDKAGIPENQTGLHSGHSVSSMAAAGGVSSTRRSWDVLW